MHLVSCANTHRGVTDFVNHEIVKNTKKLEYLENGTHFFYEIKKILNLCFR